MTVHCAWRATASSDIDVYSAYRAAPGYTRIIAAGRAQRAGREFAFANSLLAHAAWIVAESPQEAHRRFRGLEAESLVFRGQGICAANSLTAKNAPFLIGKGGGANLHGEFIE
jgi:hypothetical protein